MTAQQLSWVATVATQNVSLANLIYFYKGKNCKSYNDVYNMQLKIATRLK